MASSSRLPADIRIPIPQWNLSARSSSSALEVLDLESDPLSISRSAPFISTSPSSFPGVHTPPREEILSSEMDFGQTASSSSTVSSPPTPAPTPRLSRMLSDTSLLHISDVHDLSFNRDIRSQFVSLDPAAQRCFLTELISACDVGTLAFLSTIIIPRLKRDFLRELPTELALYILSFVDEPRTLARASCVSQHWNHLLTDEYTWKAMCARHGFKKKPRQSLPNEAGSSSAGSPTGERGETSFVVRPLLSMLPVPDSSPLEVGSSASKGKSHAVGKFVKSLKPTSSPDLPFSYKHLYKISYLTDYNWRQAGHILRTHVSPDDGVVTSVAMDDEWIVIGLANHRIHVFDAKTGARARTLVGHTLGVWCLNLVSRGGVMGKPPADPSVPSYSAQPSDFCNSSLGWGQAGAIAVSGGCDREVRVWDVKSGCCLHILKGHGSTIRCVKVLDGRPIAVTGSRDATLRVWDIQRGRCLHVLEGHTLSVRCLDVSGNLVVSGSYDNHAKLWNIDTGECLRTFEGHYHQIYAVAFDGERIATGSLDSTVRVWSAQTGQCLALLQGHTSLVGQLQLSNQRLVTGGSDGRAIIFSLETLETVTQICAHDNSVTCLQFDDKFLITGGNDGHVKLFELATGRLIRELTEPCEAVWRVCFKEDKAVVMCKRAGKTVVEILSFRPLPEDD